MDKNKLDDQENKTISSYNSFMGPGFNDGVGAAVLTQAVKENSGPQAKETPIDYGLLKAISGEAERTLDMNNQIMDIFPDVDFCATSVAQSMIAPNDGTTNGTSVTLENFKYSAELKNKLIAGVEEDLTYYNYRGKQVSSIVTAMYLEGVKCDIYIPEAVMSEAIGSSVSGELTLESYAARNVSRSGPQTIFRDVKTTYGDVLDLTLENSVKLVQSFGTSVGNIENDMLFEFTDNVAALNESGLEEELIMNKVDRTYLTTESSSNKPTGKNSMIMKNLFRDPANFNEQTKLNLPEYATARRESIGRPFHIEPQSFAVKPIWSGLPSNHLGYILLLDSNGDTLKYTREFDEQMGQDEEKLSSEQSIKNVLDKVKNSTMPKNTSKDLKNNEAIYGDIVDKFLMDKFENSDLKGIAKFNDNQDITRIMFRRAMKGKKTKILFLPKSLVSYYAFDYRENGMGKSKLEKVALLYGMRAAVLFTTMASTVKNSVSNKKITVQLSEDIKDTKPAIAAIDEHIFNSAHESFPTTMSLQKMEEWTKRIGTTVHYKHPSIPDTDVTVDETSPNVSVPDGTLMEMLEEYTYMQFGLNSDYVKNGLNQANFATTLMSQNKFYKNRIIGYQATGETCETRHVRTIIRNDAVARDRIKKIITEHMDEFKDIMTKFELTEEDVLQGMVDTVLDSIKVTLPTPDEGEGTTLTESFDKFSRSVDDFLEGYFNRDTLTSLGYGEEIADKAEYIKAVIKSEMLKEYVNDNKMFDGFRKFITPDENGEPQNNYFTSFGSTQDTISKMFKEFYEKGTQTAKENDKDITDINNSNQDAAGGAGDGTDNNSEGGSTGDDY